MVDFPAKYKTVTLKDKTGIVAANHKNKELLISEDVKIKTTADGKLCTTFPNSGSKSSIPLFSGKNSDSGCSLTISDPSTFNYCIQKDGTYQLSGSNVTFDGTDKNDKLVLNEVNNSKINLGKGNDSVSINGTSPRSSFQNNIINTGEGNDTVEVTGNFGKFRNNQFYLGKGSDKFSALINPNDDAKTKSEFESKLPQYGRTVSKNEIYAIDGYTPDGDKKGWFENNTFESKTYSANQLFRYDAASATVSGADGFQTYKFKPEPKSERPISQQKETQKTTKQDTTVVSKPKKLTQQEIREKCSAQYSIGSFRAWMFNDTKGQEDALKALDDYVESMKK